MLDLEYEFLCELIAYLNPTQIIGSGPYGERRIMPVKGGTITGSKLKGEILPFGADWVLVRSDGVCELDIRITIRTDDGELIYMRPRGIFSASPKIWERITKGDEVNPSEYYFCTTPIFETGSEKYWWVNSIIAVGVGAYVLGQVHYKIYQIL